MSDWDFLYEMHEQGYSAEEIMDAAACGYNPYELDLVFDEIIADEIEPVVDSDQKYAGKNQIFEKNEIFNNLIDNARHYFELTGRYLQIWGELGELYAELEFRLQRHKQPNQAGSDGIINGKLVEVKTISPVKQNNKVFVKSQGDFELLLIIRISKNFEFEAKLISRDKLNQYGKFLKTEM
ncbi:MAG: hypothetical protein IJV35_01615 [Neisseriaceae bacterium]|nr:hypothetical protein [Neisseriaceae bacterium]